MSVINDTIGLLFIGTILDVLGLGINVMAYYTYFRTDTRESDPIAIRYMIPTLLVLDTSQTILALVHVYNAVITNFGQTKALGSISWFYAVSMMLSFATALTCQHFFAWRVHRLLRRTWLTIIISLLSWSMFLSGMAYATGLGILHDLDKLSPLYPAQVLSSSSAIASDVVISLALCLYLTNHRTGFAHTDNLISKIMFLTVQTGCVTSAGSIVILITYATSSSMAAAMMFTFLPKIYSISLLSSLNMREAWKSNSSRSHTGNTHSAGPRVHITTERAILEDIEIHDMSKRAARVGNAHQMHSAADSPLAKGASITFQNTTYGARRKDPKADDLSLSDDGSEVESSLSGRKVEMDISKE